MALFSRLRTNFEDATELFVRGDAGLKTEIVMKSAIAGMLGFFAAHVVGEHLSPDAFRTLAAILVLGFETATLSDFGSTMRGDGRDPANPLGLSPVLASLQPG